ncbi:MAG TPA: ribonuclease HI family protein, partial [Acidobacteriaceae bacterium]
MTEETESKALRRITAYCDGGSRGNPGPAGYGVFIQAEDGTTLGELSEFLGVKTNNVAEYFGLLAALGFAIEHGHPYLRVVSDSELMVKQIKGQYSVKSPDLKPLYEEAKRRASQLKKFEMQHVLRGKNKEADRLANEAMDKGTGKGPAGRPSSGGRSSAATVSAVSPVAAIAQAPRQPRLPLAAPSSVPAEVTGFVRNGVVHLVEGELPEGTFV